jgi:UDP-glucose 4-epimerase
MLKVSVLGCNSFIGKHLVDSLIGKDDIKLTVFARNAERKSNGKLHFVQGDFENPAALQEALRGQDIVYHFISQTIPSSTWNFPLLEIEKNLTPSLQLIELAAAAGVKKICFASSGGTVYGLQKNLLTEESPTEPISPHGIIKRTIESFLQYAKLKHRINYDIYRISNVYGEGQRVANGLGFINTALENIVSNRSITVFGDGENVRDYVYVKDVADLLALSTYKNLEDSDIYNVCSNYAISLNHLIALIKDVTKTDFEVKYVENRLSDNRTVLLDNSKIMNLFKEYSLTSLADGIKNTYDYLKKTSLSAGKSS